MLLYTLLLFFIFKEKNVPFFLDNLPYTVTDRGFFFLLKKHDVVANGTVKYIPNDELIFLFFFSLFRSNSTTNGK